MAFRIIIPESGLGLPGSTKPGLKKEKASRYFLLAFYVLFKQS